MVLILRAKIYFNYVKMMNKVETDGTYEIYFKLD